MITTIHFLLGDLLGSLGRVSGLHPHRSRESRRSLGFGGLVEALPEDPCVGAFKPKVGKGLPRGDRFLLYHWDGERIDRCYDYADDGWLDL